MDTLYAPWRGKYVSTVDKKINGCVFCHIKNNTTKSDDEELGVLHREKEFFIVMNKYPYAPAHFMIIPNTHTSNLEDLDPTVWTKMTLFAQMGVRLLKDTVNATGVNIGMNLGEVGGAGIAEHIHLHLVPRWMGDTNFITTISNTRVYSGEFQTIYKLLKEKAPQYFKSV